MFKDYIEITNINSAGGYLGDDFKKIKKGLSNKYSGTKGNISDEERAIELVNGSFSIPLGKIYSYNPVNNSITIPAGILQEPFYYKDGSKEQNYEAIGSIIGHELIHAFDNIRPV